LAQSKSVGAWVVALVLVLAKQPDAVIKDRAHVQVEMYDRVLKVDKCHYNGVCPNAVLLISSAKNTPL
jgi:hypothetical protein